MPKAAKRKTAEEVLTLPHPVTTAPATFRLHRVEGDGHCFFQGVGLRTIKL